MGYCLPKAEAEKFLAALRSGKIVPEKLTEMTSAERRSYFEGIVGKEDAFEVNAQFESKLLLVDQKRGLVTWAKQIAGLKEATRRDLISKIERLEQILTPENEAQFLSDLAAKKLGVEVTAEEAQHVVDLTREAVLARDSIPADAPIRSKIRLEYGVKSELLREYVDTLSLREVDYKLNLDLLKSPARLLELVGAVSKAMVATGDFSFFGLQGGKLLAREVMTGRILTGNSIWAKTLLAIVPKFFAAFKGTDPMLAIRADIASRPNALNGRYEKGFDLGVRHEEAFPTSLPERIPIIGRAYKAFEVAFNGAALRMRADLADLTLERAEKFGVNLNDSKQVRGLALLVNSMTGRGHVGLSESQAKFTNAVLFSVRFMKSNLDILTAHRLGYGIPEGKVRSFARREAARNITSVVGFIGTIMFLSDLLNPGSVEWDARSSRFGKIRYGKTDQWIDISMGLRPFVVLAARTVPTKHGSRGGLFGNGWSFWSKSNDGEYKDLASGKFGQATALDYIVNTLLLNKLSPMAGIARDVWKGETFEGEKPTLKGEALSLVTPIAPADMWVLAHRSDAANFWAALLLQEIGWSVTPY